MSGITRSICVLVHHTIHTCEGFSFLSVISSHPLSTTNKPFLAQLPELTVEQVKMCLRVYLPE